ncbi:MAG: S8 family serine peptidase [Burkholderiaceae bacterium]|nr:S8 family serine peptidase [Burkholderiaceae bacterium]
MNLLRALVLAGLATLATAPWVAEAQPGPQAEPGLIIVALADHRPALPAVGGTARASYRRGAGYGAGLGSEAAAEALARDFKLQVEDGWTIAPLKLHCLLFRLAAGADSASVLAALARDPRVALAQPLNLFETLATPETAPDKAAYNDPYIGLQRGFTAMGVAEAQRWSRGAGVRVALIDTGLDASHPDLQGRVLSERNFVAQARGLPAGGERHGTQMAGVIAAVANNRQGIVGIAPEARLLAYRACWDTEAGRSARCDSFTLARALGAAIAADADIINLSLSGPADPLLQKLTEHALTRGIIVVGAVPASGSGEGFPGGVPGVLAVRALGDTTGGTQVLSAPGRDILTLNPGGSYDFASGSSLAAAHVTGTVALLRALHPALNAELAQRWLAAPPLVNACTAMRHLRSLALCIH